MAIKSGELIHVANVGVLIDRLQTAGPGRLNVPTERIKELGNYESVAVVRNTPDLQFPMEGLDVSTEVEAMLVRGDAVADAAGTEYDLADNRPIDVLGQFKAGRKATDPFLVVGSAVIPYLALESASYRFGLQDNATQNFQFRGDSIFYSQVGSFVEEVAGSGTANQAIALANEPIPYNGDVVAGTRYALSVTLAESGQRLAHGTDYTEALATGVVTVTILEAVPATDTIRITYQSATPASYPQASHALASATRPAAVKGKHLELRVGGVAITDRWSSVQSATIDWRVTLERDEEFGNPNVVSQDFDVPDVNGSVTIRPRNYTELIDRIKQIAGVAGTEVVGPDHAVSLPFDLLVHSPDDGAVLKTFHVPDAKFTLPGYDGRVEQRLDVEFPWESDGGILKVVKGARI